MDSPTQKPRNAFPSWRLPDGMIKATENQLDGASLSCERWEWGCAGLVAIAVAAEFVIAWIHPSYSSSLERWGSAWADLAVLFGILGEVFFSRRDSKIQTELRKRSNDKLGAAEERAAKLEIEAAQLRLQWKRWIKPRSIIDRAAFLEELKGVPTPLTVEILCVMSPEEPWLFACEVHLLLASEAQWPIAFPVAVALTDSRLLPGAISTVDPGKPSSAIRLWISPADAEKNPDARAQVAALRSAIESAIGVTAAGQNATLPEGILRMVIFAKA